MLMICANYSSIPDLDFPGPYKFDSNGMMFLVFSMVVYGILQT